VTLVINSLHKYILLTIFIILVLSIAWMGCSREDSTPVSPTAPFEVSWEATPPNLVFQSAAYYPMIVSVGGIAPEAVDSVKATIEDSTSQQIGAFHLYDDANAYEHADALDFCSPHSDDLVSRDGKFSRLINARFAAEEGHFIFRVTAWFGGESVQTTEDTVSVALSVPPQLSNLTLPDTLESGFSPLQISLLAIDPDPPSSDSVTSVEMKLYSPGGALLGDPTQLEPLGNGLYGTTLTADLAVGYSSDLYTFAFRARDTFDEESDSLGRQVYMENLAPYLTDATLPDTVVLPPATDTTYFPITVRCWDDQTVEDISQVSIQALKPDTVTWGSLVELFDDGDFDYSGDEVAGDSVYTRIVAIYPSNDLGLYQFYFRAEDKAGNQSEIVDSLWVIP